MSNPTEKTSTDFEALCDDLDFWREVVGALKTSRHDSRKRVPRVPGGMRAMHERAESLENVTDALKDRKAVLKGHKGQARIAFPKPSSDGNFEMVLASGVRAEGGFLVNPKGKATNDLIALQFLLQIDYSGENKKIADEGAFLILSRETVEVEGEPDRLFQVLHFAYPARLEREGTFIWCDQFREVGRYELIQPTPKAAQVDEKATKSVEVKPQIQVKKESEAQSPHERVE